MIPEKAFALKGESDMAQSGVIEALVWIFKWGVFSFLLLIMSYLVSFMVTTGRHQATINFYLKRGTTSYGEKENEQKEQAREYEKRH